MKKSLMPPLPEMDSLIVEVRGRKVILDADLARVYGVPTKVFNQAVKRHQNKFPEDFMFRLTKLEAEAIVLSRSQSVTLKRGQNIKYAPNAFTEHGAIMAANILNSPRATQMSVFVVRAFVKLRSVLADSQELARKLAAVEAELKSRLDVHEVAIVDILQRIMKILDPPPLPPDPPEPPKPEIGFHVKEESASYRTRRSKAQTRS